MEDIFWAPQEDDNYKLLHQAAVNGDDEALVQAIRSNVRLEAYFGRQSSDDGTTAIHTAAWEGHISIVRTLLAHDVDVDLMDRDMFGRTPPIYFAAENHQVDVIKCLLDAGACTKDVFGPNEDSLLSVVLRQPKRSAEARIRTLSVLLDHGVDIDVQHMYGPTVLDRAIMEETIPIIHFLQRRGASFARALDTAVRHNRLSLFPVLLAAGAVDRDFLALSEASRRGKLDMMNMLLQHLQDTSSPATSGGPVCAAASHGQLPAVKILLDGGFAINEPDTLGLRPLHYAVISLRCDLEVVQLLLARGADPLASTVGGLKPWYPAGMSSLHLAADCYDLSVIQKLVEISAPLLDERVGSGLYPEDTPLLALVRKISQNVGSRTKRANIGEIRLQALTVLLDTGANIDAVDHLGRTSLHILAATDDQQLDAAPLDAIKLLLGRGADHELKDKDGMMAFGVSTNDSISAFLSGAPQPADRTPQKLAM